MLKLPVAGMAALFSLARCLHFTGDKVEAPGPPGGPREQNLGLLVSGMLSLLLIDSSLHMLLHRLLLETGGGGRVLF